MVGHWTSFLYIGGSSFGEASAVVLGLPCSMPIIMDVFQMVAGQGGPMAADARWWLGW